MSERAEKLREAVVTALLLEDERPSIAVCAAIVRELGITREMVREIQRTPTLCDAPDCLQCAAPRVLTTLLDAAGEP